MTLAGFTLVGLAVLVAAFVQGSSGMGFAMLCAPLVGLVDASLIPVMLLVLMLPLNCYVAWRERAHVHRQGVAWISVGRFAGTFAGLWILLVVDLHQLALLIGISTVLAALVALLAPAFEPHRGGLAMVGVVTGVTETSTGVGGPPLALAYQHTPGPVLRSTVAVCFLIGEVISLAVLTAGGKVDGHTVITALVLLPFLALGSFASRFVHHRLDGPLLRYLVLGFAIVSGIAVILEA